MPDKSFSFFEILIVAMLSNKIYFTLICCISKILIWLTWVKKLICCTEENQEILSLNLNKKREAVFINCFPFLTNTVR